MVRAVGGEARVRHLAEETRKEGAYVADVLGSVKAGLASGGGQVRARVTALVRVASTVGTLYEESGFRGVARSCGLAAAGLVALPSSLSLLVAAVELWHAGGAAADGAGHGRAQTIVPLALPLGFVFGAAAAAGVVVVRLILALRGLASGALAQALGVAAAAGAGYVAGDLATRGPPEAELAATAAVVLLGLLLLGIGANGAAKLSGAADGAKVLFAPLTLPAQKAAAAARAPAAAMVTRDKKDV